MYLDDVPDLECEVGYGKLGRRGDLGYEGKAVVVRGERFAHALSAHAPSRLKARLDRRFKAFATEVALTDDVPADASWADFLCRVDGRLCAIASHVHRGELPRRLEVSVEGAQELELIAETSRWEQCHSVWLDPVLREEGYHRTEQTIVDPLKRAEITLVTPLPRTDSCIATVASAGLEGLLEEMLASLAVHGGCPEALVVVFAVDAGTECERVAKAHGAHVVRCRRKAVINSTIKSVLYSAARIIDARQFICLDADMLVLGGLAPLFAALEVAPSASILACREANGYGLRDLNHAIQAVYGGCSSDLHRIMNGARGGGEL